jgi:hypothetical protein
VLPVQAVLDGLNLCRQLTRLEFYCRMPHMRPTDLATCLAQRTSLVTLTISSLTLDDGGSQPGAVHGWRQVGSCMQALVLIGAVPARGCFALLLWHMFCVASMFACWSLGRSSQCGLGCGKAPKHCPRDSTIAAAHCVAGKVLLQHFGGPASGISTQPLITPHPCMNKGSPLLCLPAVQLLRSIASLPRLQRLKLWGLTWNSPVGSVIHELAALSSSSLTHLELAYSAVNDSSALR